MKLSEFLEYLENRNREFITDQKDLSKMAKAQHPFMTLIECSDSRVDTSDIGFGGKEALDRVFRIENIWNTVWNNEWSVEYWVLHLKTPILFIFAHTNCGAIKAALFEYDHLSSAIKRELDYIKPALEWLENIKDMEERWFKWVLANLEYQVNYAYNKFKDLVNSGKLAIIGGLEDTDNSLWWWYDKYYTKFVLAKDNFEFKYH